MSCFERVIGVLLACACLAPMHGQAGEGPLVPGATTRQQLVIASSNNFPPINMLDQEGRLTGFGRDMADAVARELDIEVRHIHSAIWPEVLGWLEDGSADLIHDAGYTPERETFLDFTLPIIEMPEAIFVRDQQFDIHDMASLSGKKVACVNKHITHLYLQGFKEIDCYLVNTPAEGFIALINGNADAFIYPEQIVRYLAQHLKLEQRIKVVGEPLRMVSWSMTVKKGNAELLKRLNHGIKAVRQSGEYQRIYDKWFGRRQFHGYTQQEVAVITMVAVLLSLLAVITLALLLYTRGMRKAHRALAKSESKYRTLADKLPECVFLKDTNSVYLSCNQRYADSLGIRPEEIVGRTDFDFHPEHAAEYQAGDRRIMETGETQEFVESYSDDGKAGYINTIKTPVYDDRGELVGVLGIFWDITEHLALQDRLNAAIMEHDTIIATVPDVMYKLDAEGRFVWWNPTLEAVTGLGQAQLSNLSALELIAEDDRDKAASAIREIFEQGVGEVEVRLLTRIGLADYYFNGARLLDDEGGLVGLVGSGRDMSRQKEAERQHDLLQKQLLQAQKMESIGQLTGGIAHDFNNILASILGYGELALRAVEAGQTPAKLRDYLAEIVRSGKRARDLVAQMLTFSRASKAEPRAVAVAEFVDEVIAMLRPMIPSTITIQKDLQDSLPRLSIDPVKIQQMLLNLCINARDAMEGKGRIIIQATRCLLPEQVCDSCHLPFHGDYVELAVSDDGPGIDPQVIDRIFEPFMTTKEVGHGTGMGLAMVHGIIHDHGGHILVQSAPGHTCFNIYLPVGDQGEPAAETEHGMNGKASVFDAGRHRVLVLDDEVALSELLREMLELQGYRVTVEHDGKAALRLFEANPDGYDLVITDQTMPGLSGSEVAREMLAVRPQLPIVLCTGYSDRIDEHGAKQIGIKAFLAKPVDSKALLGLVQQLLAD